MRSLYVSEKGFKRQMWILKRLGYTGLSLSELQPYLQGKKSGRVVGITFDDGYLNNLTHAAPILKSFDFSATCYVVSDLIGSTNSWDKEIGVPSAPLMSLEHLKEWLNHGQEIGSHSLTHSSLLKVPHEQAKFEIVQSKTQLEGMLGVAVNQFCYPYGDYAKAHLEWVRLAGYWAATTTKRGRVFGQISNEQKMNPQLCLELSIDFPYELVRVPVVRSTTWAQFLLKIATSYEDQHS